jgi:hypothetical protein
MPEPPPSEADEGRLRASDGDREAVVERLRQAHADGRLDLTEFDERTRSAYAARTYAELATLTSDLPPMRAATTGGAERDQPAPGLRPLGRALGDPSRRIVGSPWFFASFVNLVIWAIVCVATTDWIHPWWIWVAGPWGAVLVARWLGERARGEH